MNSQLYCIGNRTMETGSSTATYKITWTIHDIKWLLDNQTNREIRTKKINICKRDDQEGCFMLRIRLLGEDNESVKVYFKVYKFQHLRCILSIQNMSISMNNGNDLQWISKKKWQFLKGITKETIKRSNISDLNINFLFVVNLCHRIEPAKGSLMYPLQEFQTTSPDNLSTSVQGLLMNSAYSDVKIKSVDGDEISAHKCFLGTRSPVFKASFEHMLVENANVIESPFATEVLINVLNYIYTDNAPDLDDMADKLLKAADFYDLSGLKILCETHLIEALTVENAVEMLELANLHGAIYLKRKTLEFISDGLAGEITLTEGWKKLQSTEIIKSIYEFVLVR